MKKTVFYFLIFIFGWIMADCTLKQEEENKLRPADLQCDYLKNPPALNEPAPYLSWIFSSQEHIQTQQAYHILVSSSEEKINNNIGDLWDSGRINSNLSQHIKYDGIALESKQKVYWKVRVWGQDGKSSEWSETNNWRIGLLDREDWKASWIGISEDKNPDLPETNPAPYFRKELSLNKKVKSAIVYACGLGYYEFYLNGKKVGDNVLAPAPTNYDRRNMKNLLYNFKDRSKTRVLYNTFDVTHIMRQGENIIGMILGNG